MEELWTNINLYLIILNRNNIDVLEYLEKLNKKDKYVIVNDLPNIDISSTLIRNKLNNKDYDLSMYVDDCILNYIRENNLYGGIHEKNSK